MHFLLLSFLADNAPSIQPNLNFPGSQWLIKIVGVILGLIALAFVALFFNGLFKTVRSVGGHHEGGAGGGGGLMIASVIGLVIVLTGTAFLNQWLNFFG